MGGGTRYWIDGWNVILRLGLGGDAPLAERRAELVARVAASGFPAWIAFDSRERIHGVRDAHPRRIEVAFAPPGKSADALILEHVRRAKDLDGVVVVSDDRAITERCGFLGVRTLGVAEFGKRLRPGGPAGGEPSRDRRLSSGEVKDWMKWFGLEGKPPPEGDEGGGRGGGGAAR